MSFRTNFYQNKIPSDRVVSGAKQGIQSYQNQPLFWWDDAILYTLRSKKCSPFLFHCSFYKCQPISIIFGTQHTKVICNTTIIDMSTSAACCCYYLGKYLDYFGWFVLSTKLCKWYRNVMMKSDQWKIFTVVYFHDVELNASAKDALFTCVISVLLTSSSKAVCQHIMHIRQLSLLQHKTPKFTGQAYGLQLGLCVWNKRLL